MYSVFNSNTTTHLDSFWQMKPSFLINSANKNIYSFVPHITVSIILVKYDLLLRDNCSFRTGYFSYKAKRSEEFISSLYLQAGSCLSSSQPWRQRGTRFGDKDFGECILANHRNFPWRPSDARKRFLDFSLGTEWNLSSFLPTS